VAVLGCVITPVFLLSSRDAESPADAPVITYEVWLAGPSGLPGDDVRRRAEEIYESFAGTAEERDALGFVLVFREFGLAEAWHNRDHVSPEEKAAWAACSQARSDGQPTVADIDEPLVGEQLVDPWWRATRAYPPAGLPSINEYVDCLGAARPIVLDFPGSDVREMFGNGHWEIPGSAHVPLDPTDPEQWADDEWQRFPGRRGGLREG
jgi:hypothetical protein